MRTKSLTALLAISITMTSLQLNANCLDKYNNVLVQTDKEVTAKEMELNSLKARVDNLRDKCGPNVIGGVIVSLLALPLATAGVALLSPLAIYSGAATLATVAPFFATGSAVMVGGVKIAKGDPEASLECSVDTYQKYANQISSVSYELINLKYLQYSQGKIASILSDVSRNEAGPDTIEFLRRMKIVLPNTKKSNSEILDLLREVDQSNLLCEDSFMLTNPKSIEKGLEKIVDKSIVISEIQNHNIANPFTESEAREKLSKLVKTSELVKKQIRELKIANKEINQSTTQIDQAMNSSEGTLQERRAKYLALVSLKDILNNGLGTVLKLSTSLEDLEKTQLNLKNEIKHIKKILAIKK